MRRIDAVIFDMDGLLLDSERLAMDALVSAGTALGYDIPPAFCHLMIGAPADRCRELVTERYGADFPLERYFATQEEHLRALVAAGRLALKRGVGELLDALDRHRIPRAIATSSSRARTDHHLALVSIAARFDHIVTRDDVPRGKPNPDPFLKAASLLGVAPEGCLVLEDSFNGIRAAHAAAMRVVMVPDLLDPTEEMRGLAHRIVDSLHDVIGLIEESRHAAAA
ncbi:HAD family hydrolase [Rhizosaccharibacter radicis]|uniref:HAD family phosphatase n=1 Tax=Rhizosaccharibacter radicis TaxID=2782605 RepID=A0ABT1VT27_9PROT|nr:HAD family phosphatase [Acetobacteraceae bacterium KSS12]